MSDTVVIENRQIITVEAPEQVSIVSAGEQGPPGPPGTTSLAAVAGEALGGHRVVVITAGTAVYADNTNPLHTSKVLGITTGAAILGDLATIQTGGEIIEPTWAWTLDLPIFLGTTGLLTQTPPTTGFSQIIGFPTSATSMFVNLRDPLTLI